MAEAYRERARSRLEEKKRWTEGVVGAAASVSSAVLLAIFVPKVPRTLAWIFRAGAVAGVIGSFEGARRAFTANNPIRRR